MCCCLLSSLTHPCCFSIDTTFPAQLSAQSTSRAEFLSQITTAGLAAAIVGVAQPANAAKYGSIGVGSPNVMDPKEVIIDDDIFKSSDVQKALQDLKAYSDVVQDLKKALSSNDQEDLGPVLRKKFDPSKLRTDLNTLNNAFDEDTQRGTDRLIRGILQNVAEVEVANKQKDGIERSARRLANVNSKLDKLQASFDDFLKFAN